jgi:hypothetical protein
LIQMNDLPAPVFECLIQMNDLPAPVFIDASHDGESISN